MATWVEPKNNYKAEDQVLPTIFNVLAENERYLKEVKITIEQVKDAVIAYTASGTRVNIASGDTIKTAFGKIQKWFADLGSLAFKSTVGTSDISSQAVTDAKIKSVAASKVTGLATVATSGDYNDLKNLPTNLGGITFRKLHGPDGNYNQFDLNGNCSWTITPPSSKNSTIMIQGMLTCANKYWVTAFLKQSNKWSYSCNSPVLFWLRSVNGEPNKSYGFISMEFYMNSGNSVGMYAFKVDLSNMGYQDNRAKNCYFALDGIYELVGSDV